MAARISRKLFCWTAVFLIGCSVMGKNYLQESAEDREARMAWWKEARFGMFIHWGVYSVLGGTYRGEQVPGISEWIMHRAAIPVEDYEQYARMFNPVFFDADEWVRAAAEAGMKYIVITSKHHDGFALWDSRVSDWDVMDASPFKRDILKELAAACEKRGIRLCFYHSIMDWHHPDAQAAFYPTYNNREATNPRFPLYVENYLKPQLKELLTGYGDLGILWFDGEWMKDYTTDMGNDVYNYVRNLQPDIIINNRVDKGRQGMQGLNREGSFAGDYGTPEQEIPDTGIPGLDWESCMTMNRSWGWKSFDDDWKSAEVLITNLIDIVSKGGNYLLNVGPTHEGLIPAPSIERLRAMGEWLDTNGESIYGAEASPFDKPDWGRYTHKPGALFAHIFDWPADGRLVVPKLQGKSYTSIHILGTRYQIEFASGGASVVIELPADPPDAIATVVKLEY